MNKSYRQGQILKLIRSHHVHTQEDLAKALRAIGIPATQVTLSRDIRELGLIKTPDGYAQSWPIRSRRSGSFHLDSRFCLGRSRRAEPIGAAHAAGSREPVASRWITPNGPNHRDNRRRRYRPGGHARCENRGRTARHIPEDASLRRLDDRAPDHLIGFDVRRLRSWPARTNTCVSIDSASTLRSIPPATKRVSRLRLICTSPVLVRRINIRGSSFTTTPPNARSPRGRSTHLGRSANWSTLLPGCRSQRAPSGRAACRPDVPVGEYFHRIVHGEAGNRDRLMQPFHISSRVVSAGVESVCRLRIVISPAVAEPDRDTNRPFTIPTGMTVWACITTEKKTAQEIADTTRKRITAAIIYNR